MSHAVETPLRQTEDVSSRVVHRTVIRADQELDVRSLYMGGVSQIVGGSAVGQCEDPLRRLQSGLVGNRVTSLDHLYTSR